MFTVCCVCICVCVSVHAINFHTGRCINGAAVRMPSCRPISDPGETACSFIQAKNLEAVCHGFGFEGYL